MTIQAIALWTFFNWRDYKLVSDMCIHAWEKMCVSFISHTFTLIPKKENLALVRLQRLVRAAAFSRRSPGLTCLTRKRRVALQTWSIIAPDRQQADASP